MHHTGLDLRKVKDSALNPATPINDVWITSYYGGPTNPHPEQSIWYDNLVVGTNYIGPDGAGTKDTTPPSKPTGLNLQN